ncbi:MAG: hypothetical protein OXR72_18270 [Gemmatimonadota bacterium]|nr:hypothetical protein [Gemmatimonadota bacterium]
MAATLPVIDMKSMSELRSSIENNKIVLTAKDASRNKNPRLWHIEERLRDHLSGYERHVRDARSTLSHLVEVIENWISALKPVLHGLEYSPDDYIAMYNQREAERRISEFRKNEEELKAMRSEFETSLWTSFLNGLDEGVDTKLVELDERLYDLISLIQEVRWRMLTAHGKSKERPEKTYQSAEEAIADLWG